MVRRPRHADVRHGTAAGQENLPETLASDVNFVEPAKSGPGSEQYRAALNVDITHTSAAQIAGRQGVTGDFRRSHVARRNSASRGKKAKPKTMRRKTGKRPPLSSCWQKCWARERRARARSGEGSAASNACKPESP